MTETSQSEVFLRLMKTDYQIYHRWKKQDTLLHSTKCRLIPIKITYGLFLLMTY